MPGRCVCVGGWGGGYGCVCGVIVPGMCVCVGGGVHKCVHMCVCVCV